MGRFLKEFDETLYNQYRKEVYIESGAFNKPTKRFVGKRDTFLDVKEETPDTTVKIDYKGILSGSPFIHLSDLPDDHITKRYLRLRKIPESTWERLAYIPKMSRVYDFCSEYENLKGSSEDRLVIPVISTDFKLSGATCRALNNNAMRYIELKFDSDSELIVGMERLKVDETKYITEGWADSFLLDNSAAMLGIAPHKLNTKKFDKASTVVVVDNQPKHSQVVQNICKIIDLGFKVSLLPRQYIGKDFNAMVIDEEIKIEEIKGIIDAYTYQGLNAKLQFAFWRKV
jgi:hypothetical protein